MLNKWGRGCTPLARTGAVSALIILLYGACGAGDVCVHRDPCRENSLTVVFLPGVARTGSPGAMFTTLIATTVAGAGVIS